MKRCHRDGDLPCHIPTPGVRPGAITGRHSGRGRLHVFGTGLAAGVRLCHQLPEGQTTQKEEGW